MIEHMLVDMKQILVELDEETAKRLEKVAPARSRRRSQFIREAVRRLLDELEERRMAEAYRRQPETEPAFFDPRAWEPWKPRGRSRRR